MQTLNLRDPWEVFNSPEQANKPEPRRYGARPVQDYSLDGIIFNPPPEDVLYRDTYRVNIKQTLAGQLAQKGGAGGMEIVIRGKVPWTMAGWFNIAMQAVLANADEETFMVWFDPVSQRSYEVVCLSDEFNLNVTQHGFYHYTITLHGQVLGAAWAAEPLALAGITDTIPAFDIASIDVAVADAEYWADHMNEQQQQQGQNNAGSGTQQPSQTGGTPPASGGTP